MKKYIILILVTALLLGLFAGCGTTKKVLDDESDGSIVLAPLSALIEEDMLEITPFNYVEGAPGSGIPGAIVRAYKDTKYTDLTLKGEGVVASNGGLAIGLEDEEYEVLYVVQIESGKRESVPAVLVKPGL